MRKETCLVTGASRGIGAAVAEQFAKKGYTVILCARSLDTLTQLATRLRTKHPSATIHAFQADFSDPDSITQLFQQINSSVSELTILVNNAATLSTALFESQDLSEIRAMFEVNVFGLAQCTQLAIPLLKKSGGSILNISSLAGIKSLQKFPGLCGYTMTKNAVVGFTENLAVELKADNIRVNCIAPGAVGTEMLNTAFPDYDCTITPSDAADSICFLAENTSLTGTTLELHFNG